MKNDTPKINTYIYLVKSISDKGEKHRSCFPALSEQQAIHSYKMRHIDKENWHISASLVTCNDTPITVLHLLSYGTKFKTVNVDSFNGSKFSPHTDTFIKMNYCNVDHTYLCLDEHGKKHYISTDTWCIVAPSNAIQTPQAPQKPEAPEEPPISSNRNYIIKYNDINRVEIYKEPSFNYVMIKTTEEMMVNDRGGSLYEATRRYWRASDRITKYTYIISVVDQIVQRVYIAERWKLYMPGEDGCPTTSRRWGFVGREASGEEIQKLIGKRIPEYYRTPGNANPVLYKKQ